MKLLLVTLLCLSTCLAGAPFSPLLFVIKSANRPGSYLQYNGIDQPVSLMPRMTDLPLNMQRQLWSYDPVNRQIQNSFDPTAFLSVSGATIIASTTPVAISFVALDNALFALQAVQKANYVLAAHSNQASIVPANDLSSLSMGQKWIPLSWPDEAICQGSFYIRPAAHPEFVLTSNEQNMSADGAVIAASRRRQGDQQFEQLWLPWGKTFVSLAHPDKGISFVFSQRTGAYQLATARLASDDIQQQFAYDVTRMQMPTVGSPVYPIAYDAHAIAWNSYWTFAGEDQPIYQSSVTNADAVRPGSSQLFALEPYHRGAPHEQDLAGSYYLSSNADPNLVWTMVNRAAVTLDRKSPSSVNRQLWRFDPADEVWYSAASSNKRARMVLSIDSGDDNLVTVKPQQYDLAERWKNHPQVFLKGGLIKNPYLNAYLRANATTITASKSAPTVFPSDFYWTATPWQAVGGQNSPAVCLCCPPATGSANK